MNWKRTLLICILILAVAGGVVFWIFNTEPEAQRQGATKKTDMLVEVERVQMGTYQPTIVATGTVQPARQVQLSPMVMGQVVRITPSFVPGGFVQKGTLLLQLDPADFKNTLQLRESELAQVQADLEMEQGQQQVARQDYTLLGDTLSGEREALVLRKPQLNAVKARLKAAEASVDQARLNLERTAIRAPFDAQLLSRNANVGAQVGPGDSLGQLIGTDKYWVTVAIPTAQLQWLDFPKTAQQRGAPVKLTSPNAWKEGAYRTGYLFKLLGTLEGNTRMARAIVEVPDPLALKAENSGKPRLMIGAFLEAHLEGETMDSVVRLNRDLLREEETVWVMQKDSLDIRKVEVVLKDAEYAYVSSGLQAGDQIVQTNLSTVVEGAALRLPKASSADSSITSTDSRTTKDVQ